MIQLINPGEPDFEYIKEDLKKIDSVLCHDRPFLTSTNGRWNVVVKMEISDKELQEINRLLSAIPTSGP